MLKQGIEFLFIKMRKLLVMVVFLLLESEDNSYAEIENQVRLLEQK